MSIQAPVAPAGVGERRARFPLAFRAMEPAAAREVAAWRYDAPWDFYDTPAGERAAEAARMCDLASGYFAAYDADGRLVGFRCFGEDARVAGGDYDGSALDTGGGLRPDLTGGGQGAEVILSGLRFGATLYRPRAFRATVAASNGRALAA